MPIPYEINSRSKWYKYKMTKISEKNALNRLFYDKRDMRLFCEN